jgi:hypothetical protein
LSAPDIHLPTSTSEDDPPTLLGRGISSGQKWWQRGGTASSHRNFYFEKLPKFFSSFFFFVWVGDGSIEMAHCETRGGKKERELERQTKLL